MDKRPDGRTLESFGTWAAGMQCDLAGSDVSACRVTSDSDGNASMYAPSRPQTLALLLMAHEIDPGVDLCDVARAAYDDGAIGDTLWDWGFGSGGWWKGSGQMMQSLIFGVGLYDTCAD